MVVNSSRIKSSDSSSGSRNLQTLSFPFQCLKNKRNTEKERGQEGRREEEKEDGEGERKLERRKGRGEGGKGKGGREGTTV